MNADDVGEDSLLGLLGALRPRDVSPARADRLRRRCHAALRSSEHALECSASDRTSPSRLALALAAAWCATYVFEIFRRALTFYRLP